jgi:uncharacterized protein (DUF1697 family)
MYGKMCVAENGGYSRHQGKNLQERPCGFSFKIAVFPILGRIAPSKADRAVGWSFHEAIFAARREIAAENGPKPGKDKLALPARRGAAADRRERPMTRYIALLRGINVGGNNKIAMKELAAAFADAGFSGVRTYINSGNVIFSGDLDAAAAQSACEGLIARRFGLNIAVAILSAGELADALAHAPGWWGTAPGVKHSAIFVIAPATAGAVCDEVGELRPEYEKAAYHGKLIFWTAPPATISRTRWFAAITKKEISQKITIRNHTTARKLAEILEG